MAPALLPPLALLAVNLPPEIQVARAARAGVPPLLQALGAQAEPAASALQVAQAVPAALLLPAGQAEPAVQAVPAAGEVQVAVRVVPAVRPTVQAVQAV